MLGYYPACELFEFCDQEQLIHIFGCNQTLLETKGWMTKDITFDRNSITICKKNLLINLSQQKIDINDGLHGACQGGHLHLANLMIEKGATDWNWGLQGACIGGYLHLANLMIEKGATDWNWGLDGGCSGGHLHLINLMIEKGATYCNWCLKISTEHSK